jgi:hypothetical protein
VFAFCRKSRCLKTTLAPVSISRSISQVKPEELISRSELTAMLFAIADINASVERIVSLLEDGNGEQETPEENA